MISRSDGLPTRRFALPRSRITFAGIPVAIANSGISPTTTAPAPMIASRPTVEPSVTTTCGAEPDAVADVDAPRGPALLQHRDVHAIVEMIPADQIGIGGHQDALADPHARGGEDLAVEPEVGAILDDDVAVLAAEDRVAADEDAAADDDAAVVGALGVEAALIVDDDVVADGESCADGGA